MRSEYVLSCGVIVSIMTLLVRCVTRCHVGSSTGGFGFVDWSPLASWSRCPFIVAACGGRCLVMSSVVRPGHVLK